MGERACILQRQFLPVVVHEEEPVPTPRNIAMHGAEARHMHRHLLGEAEARHVGYAHPVCIVQHHGHIANGGLDDVRAGGQLAEMVQRDREADGAVPAHAQHADVVEEDDPARRRGLAGRQQQGTHEDVRPAWFVHHCGTQLICMLRKGVCFLLDRAAMEFGPAGQDDPRGFPAGVRIDKVEGGRRHAVATRRSAMASIRICRSSGSWIRLAASCGVNHRRSRARCSGHLLRMVVTSKR